LAYLQNKGFDGNHEGKITKYEAAARIRDMYVEGTRAETFGECPLVELRLIAPVALRSYPSAVPQRSVFARDWLLS
jgi:hypothetical protein